MGLNSGLEIFSKPYCTQMCCHLGFIVPFIECRGSIFSIMLKDPRIFEMVNENWLHLRSLAELAPKKRVCPLKLLSQALTSPL